jgi:hypothetical protein
MRRTVIVHFASVRRGAVIQREIELFIKYYGLNY